MFEILLQQTPAPEFWCWRLIPGLADLHRRANIWTFIPYIGIGIELFLLTIFFVRHNSKFLFSQARESAAWLSLCSFLVGLVLFALFITMCGTGHLGEYWVIDNSYLFGYQSFWVLGYWKAATAIISTLTFIFLTIISVLVISNPLRREAFSFAIKTLITPATDEAKELKEMIGSLRELNQQYER